MHETPDAAALLTLSRQLLVERLAPSLPASLRYEGLMLANALAIAGRLLDADACATTAECAELAQAIRDGRCDPGSARHDAVENRLWQITRARCAVSAPKALRREL